MVVSPAITRLHIKELVLDGFPPADRYRIAEAVQRELSRLLGLQEQSYASPPLRDADRIDGGTINVAHAAAGSDIGVGIARAIHGGLNR
jgi:hypothetical protein